MVIIITNRKFIDKKVKEEVDLINEILKDQFNISSDKKYIKFEWHSEGMLLNEFILNREDLFFSIGLIDLFEFAKLFKLDIPENLSERSIENLLMPYDLVIIINRFDKNNIKIIKKSSSDYFNDMEDIGFDKDKIQFNNLRSYIMEGITNISKYVYYSKMDFYVESDYLVRFIKKLCFESELNLNDNR